MAATSLPAPSVFSPHTLLEVESSLSPLPDRLRLLAEYIEGDDGAYPAAVAGLLMECAERIENQIARLSAISRHIPAGHEEARHA